MHFRKRSNNHSWLIFDILDDNTKRKLALVHDDGGLEPRIEWCHATEDEKPTVLKLAVKIWTTRRKPNIPVELQKDHQTVEEASVHEAQEAATDHEAPCDETMNGVPVSATDLVEEQPSPNNLEPSAGADPVKINVGSATHEAAPIC